VLGETVGYALTAAFTVLVASTVTRALAPRWMVWLGHLSAALIATGVVVPLGVHPATLTNFAGYVGWCLWLIGMAVMLWRHRSVTDDSPVLAAGRATGP
jgi:protein-S-isoprenylcysteine O-methyltransferase Ste14